MESLAGTGLPRYALPLAVTSLGTLQLTDTRPRGQEGSMLVQEAPLLKLMQLVHLPNDALLCQENGSVRYKRHSDRKSHLMFWQGSSSMPEGILGYRQQLT
jgi:hypothetical protein